jgi:hypothetical protein
MGRCTGDLDRYVGIAVNELCLRDYDPTVLLMFRRLLRVGNVNIRPFIHAMVDTNGSILATRGIHSITAAKDGTIQGKW